MAIVPALDPVAIQADFEIFKREFRGRRLAYLDSAATSLKPRVVTEAVAGYLNNYSANVHRGIYEIGEEATAAYEAARSKIAAFIGAKDAREIVMVRNATEAINLVAYAWGRKNINKADTIVTTEMEHHSNIIPWQLLTQEKDADLEYVSFDEDGRLNQDSFDVLLRTKPKLVTFTAVSNGIGTINPVVDMVRRAHEAGALVLVDGAQAVPHQPVNVQELDCDFFVFSGHKSLGPPGSGALWARREILEAMPPFMGGGEMIREVHLRHTTFNDVPYKFEAGTPDVSAAIGLGAALDYLSGLGMEHVRAHERELVAYALEVLPERVKSIRILGTKSPSERAGVITFNLADAHPHDVATLLDREAIAVRAGHHCTMPLHQRLGEEASARASFYVYTARDDIDRLAEALNKVERLFARN
ncbi:MAG: cysteine desulfurase / selenocysteine lyase [Chloroflexota bacterium]|jgi:cysteine desulfurase/selenocysteine lyase|nr:cysteine desulfurase / selenocysteine lyase [Chloroflexota bacterium]